LILAQRRCKIALGWFAAVTAAEYEIPVCIRRPSMSVRSWSRRSFLIFGAAAAALGAMAARALLIGGEDDDEGVAEEEVEVADEEEEEQEEQGEQEKEEEREEGEEEERDEGEEEGAKQEGQEEGEGKEEEEEQSTRKDLEYRVLGRTGLKVTAVALGCMVAPEQVIEKAFDLGVNWFDTAHTYKGGRSEQEVGRVLKDPEKRKRAHICTKLPRGSTQGMLQKLETSLKRLGTDYVDLLLTHGVNNESDVTNHDCMAALEKAKKDGKARFIGVSTHSNVASCIEAAIEAKIYDVVLAAYNFGSPKQVREAVARAAKARVGIIAMKTQRGDYRTPEGGLTPHQAALKWVLDDKNVTCAIPGCRSLRHLEDNFAVMKKRLSYLDRRRLARFARATAGLYCAGCGECAGACPYGVAIADVRRCSMYLDGYRDKPLARETYRSLAANAAPCLDCATCLARCVRGRPLQPLLQDTHRRLA